MKIFDWFKKKPSATALKENPVAPVVVMMHPPGQAIGSKANYKSFAEEGYMRNDVVYRCVDETARSAADVPFYLGRRLPDGALDEVDHHPVIDLLSHPNPLQSWAQFIEQLVSYYEMAGNAYVISAGPVFPVRQPKELYLLRPDRMKVLPHPFELVSGYEYRVGQEVVRFDRDQVLHLKLFHPLDDFYGLSRIQVAAMAIDKANNADEWNRNALANMAVPSGFFTSRDGVGLTEDQFEKVSKHIQDNVVGFHNAKKVHLLDQLKWESMGASPVDMDWVNGQNLNAAQIARIFGTPLELIGLMDATFENRKEARRYFYTSKILPILRNTILPGLGGWLLPKFSGGDGLMLLPNTDGVEALSEDMDKLWTRASSARGLTENERRAIMGFEAVPGGDVVLVPIGQIPLADAVAGVDEEGAEGDLGDDEKMLTGLYGCELHETGDHPLGKEDGGIQGKAFSRSERRRYRRVFIQAARRRERFQRRFKGPIKKLLAADARALAAAFRAGGEEEAVTVLARRMKEQWRPALEKLHLEVALDSGGLALDQLKAFDPGIETKAGETEAAEDLFEEIARRFSREHAAGAVTNITAATRKELAEAIATGVEQGLGIDSIVENIRERLDGINEKRARSIARTEVHNSQTSAQVEQIRALGRNDMQKGWLWSGVSRSEHAAVDGTWVPIDEKFIVGGDQMDRPGDPSGGPENVINCSCTLVFRRAR